MAEYPFTEEGVTAAVDILGDTSEQVAESLHVRRIQGDRGLCGSCPLAVYLEALYPGVTAYVDRERIRLERDVRTVEDGRVDIDHQIVDVETPDPCSDFVGDYDDLEHLRYRYLERTTP